MKLKKIHIINNPASGNDEPILNWISQGFEKSGVEWDISVTKKKGDATAIAKKLRNTVDAVCAYGGDGTVMEVALGLFKSETPMAIIPGGTANVMAKELGIPIDTKQAIELLSSSKLKEKTIDMGKCNSTPFIIRVNAGTLAKMVSEANPTLKKSIGTAAYTVAAVKHVLQPKMYTYELNLDGEKKSINGTTLVIANSGNIGIPGLSFIPNISIFDGLLDVIVFKNNDIATLVKWASNATSGKHATDVVEHFKVKKVSLKFTREQSVICDDVTLSTQKITASIIPKALKVLIQTS